MPSRNASGGGGRALALALTMALALARFPACGDDDGHAGPGIGLPPRPATAPSLVVVPADKARILSRLGREPFDTLHARIEATADRAHVDLPPDTLDSDEQQNGETALANAFLAWLHDDADRAAKARDFMDRLSDNYWSHEDIDLDIRMPSISMGYTFALDLLRGAELIPADEAQGVEDKLTTIIGEYFEDYVLDDIQRLWSLYFTQNNHPIRTACAVATVALAFPDHPLAETWANWAFSELNYLWGPKGHYVLSDGGVVEGSLYFRFAYAPSLALSLAWRNRVGEPRVFESDCINRNDGFQWADNGCVDGEPFTFVNLIDQERFQLTSDWFFALRMPDGRRPPIEDADPKRDNGAAIMAGILDRPDLLWDWYHDDQNTGGGLNLDIQHLAYLPEESELGTLAPPPWRHRVMPDIGHAVFRSGWDTDALWAMLIAEHGDARTTIHDHVDSGSIQLYAYGQYLLPDTGYYKPDPTANALTAQAGSHSLLMIDDEPVPEKGLITDYGDTDAFLENDVIGTHVAYAEARQPIDLSTTVRGLALVRDRYVVVFDRVDTSVTTPRGYTWRLHGLAGYDMGGTFTLDATAGHARFEREVAGVDAYLAAVDETTMTPVAGATPLSLVEPPYVPLEPPHVHGLRDPADHGVVDGVLRAVAPRFAAVLAPYRVGDTGADGPLVVTPLRLASGEPPETLGLAGFVVQTAEHRDLVLVRLPTAPETLTLPGGLEVATDADWAVITLEGPTAVYLIARGHFLTVEGAAVIRDATGPVTAVEP